MRTVICDICDTQLPLDNQLDTAILGIALDLCPACKKLVMHMSREEQIKMALSAFRDMRDHIPRTMEEGEWLDRVRHCRDDPSPVTAPLEGTGGDGRPPEAGTGGEPSCE